VSPEGFLSRCHYHFGGAACSSYPIQRRNQGWGTWKDEPVWSMGDGDEVAAVGPLEKGICPLDGTPITWRGVKSVALLSLKEWDSVGGGYHAWKGEQAIGPLIDVCIHWF